MSETVTDTMSDTMTLSETLVEAMSDVIDKIVKAASPVQELYVKQESPQGSPTFLPAPTPTSPPDNVTISFLPSPPATTPSLPSPPATTPSLPSPPTTTPSPTQTIKPESNSSPQPSPSLPTSPQPQNTNASVSPQHPSITQPSQPSSPQPTTSASQTSSVQPTPDTMSSVVQPTPDTMSSVVQPTPDSMSSVAPSVTTDTEIQQITAHHTGHMTSNSQSEISSDIANLIDLPWFKDLTDVPSLVPCSPPHTKPITTQYTGHMTSNSQSDNQISSTSAELIRALVSPPRSTLPKSAPVISTNMDLLRTLAASSTSSPASLPASPIVTSLSNTELLRSLTSPLVTPADSTAVNVEMLGHNSEPVRHALAPGLDAQARLAQQLLKERDNLLQNQRNTILSRAKEQRETLLSRAREELSSLLFNQIPLNQRPQQFLNTSQPSQQFLNTSQPSQQFLNTSQPSQQFTSKSQPSQPFQVPATSHTSLPSLVPSSPLSSLSSSSHLSSSSPLSSLSSSSALSSSSPLSSLSSSLSNTMLSKAALSLTNNTLPNLTKLNLKLQTEQVIQLLQNTLNSRRALSQSLQTSPHTSEPLRPNYAVTSEPLRPNYSPEPSVILGGSPFHCNKPAAKRSISKAGGDQTRPVKKSKHVGGSHAIQLWQFILELLGDPTKMNVICWTGAGLEFRIINSLELARLWGIRKRNPIMNFDKLSRALRYYYEKNIIKHNPLHRLVYSFCDNPGDIVYTTLLNNALRTCPLATARQMEQPIPVSVSLQAIQKMAQTGDRSKPCDTDDSTVCTG